eukprot:CAMPEP_0185032232 /NCGR_PEP_ID=MMETSP1103-20130426/20174_1 /TAXON_ID=36769 /ORGANISM="Paraphysomonas bandaiensis, Strain Caron Lab Isolate" /LENGTH=171 /DNA_ID=CAMNT_0027568053 /DNA_START=401 /DNA_END=916 /DNA_ORIENTATION=+
MGVFSEMHALARWICIFGALVLALFDAVSAVLVYDYIDQVRHYNAPNGEYTTEILVFYYWRDIASFGMSAWIVLTCLHLSCIVGWCQPQFVPYTSIVGGEVDRSSVFKEQRSIRRMYDYKMDLLEEKSLQREKKDKRKTGKRSRGSKIHPTGFPSNDSFRGTDIVAGDTNV